MKSVAVALGVVLASLAFALPANAQTTGDEVIFVEPLNRGIQFNFMNEFWTAPAVNRPETVCGNPGGDPNKIIRCYEFAVTYVTYDTDGDTIIHLPECNGVNPLDPDCEANNLCVASVTPELSVAALESLPARPPGRIVPGDVKDAVKELVRALREDAKVI